jgi:phage shock protein A
MDANQEHGDYTDAGVPTFEHVRDRIEHRVAVNLGAEELAAATPEAKAVEDGFEARRQAGADRLEEIRRSMRGDA